jgi:Uma2 family endonuclease
MEFMTLSPEHERARHLLGLFVAVLALELDVDIAGLGSMTCRREDLDRGLEPDDCYYIANEPQVRGRNEIDLSRDPPPDLMLEIEISRSFLNRLEICAALRVPEVWRFNGQTVRIAVLGPHGQYASSETSRAFPHVRAADLTRFLALSGTMSETKLVRAFQTWVREQIARGWAPPQSPPT